MLPLHVDLYVSKTLLLKSLKWDTKDFTNFSDQLQQIKLQTSTRLQNFSFIRIESINFADGNFSMAEIVQVFFDRKENLKEKEKNAGYLHFLFFPQCF